MERVHDQDVKMDALIRERADEIDAGIEQALGELNDRLEGARQHLAPFLKARDSLSQAGTEALQAFEKEAKIYSDFIVANMGHHPATAELGAKLFSPQDWEYMADATKEQIERDQQLYDEFEKVIPESLRSSD